MKKLLLFIPLILLMTGCQIGYVPTVVNSPLFEKKKQFSATASFLSTADVQAAYSLSDQFYIFGDMSYLLPSDEEQTDGISFSGGFGYYENLDDKSVFEIGVGAGQGYTEELYTKFYIQPTIAWRMNSGEIGLTLRGVYVNYPDLQNGSGPAGSFYSASDIFLEPVANFRIGKRRAKLQFQIGPSIPIRYYSDVGYVPVAAGIGINFRI